MSFFSIRDISKRHCFDWAEYHFSRFESYSPSAKKLFLQRYIDFANGLCKTGDYLAVEFIGFCALRYPHLVPVSSLSIPENLFIQVAREDIRSLLPYFGLTKSNPLYQQMLMGLKAYVADVPNTAKNIAFMEHDSNDIMEFLTTEQRREIAEKWILVCQEHSAEKSILWSKLFATSCFSFFQKYDVYKDLSRVNQEYVLNLEKNLLSSMPQSNFINEHKSLLPLDQYAEIIFSRQTDDDLSSEKNKLSTIYGSEYIERFTKAFATSANIEEKISAYGRSPYFMDETVLDVFYHHDPKLLQRIVSTWDAELCEHFANVVMVYSDRFTWSRSRDATVQTLFSALKNHSEFTLSLYTNIVLELMDTEPTEETKTELIKYCQIFPKAEDGLFPDMELLEGSAKKECITNWLAREMDIEEVQLQNILTVMSLLVKTEFSDDHEYRVWYRSVKEVLKQQLSSMSLGCSEPLSLDCE